MIDFLRDDDADGVDDYAEDDVDDGDEDVVAEVGAQRVAEVAERLEEEEDGDQDGADEEGTAAATLRDTFGEAGHFGGQAKMSRRDCVKSLAVQRIATNCVTGWHLVSRCDTVGWKKK